MFGSFLFIEVIVCHLDFELLQYRQKDFRLKESGYFCNFLFRHKCLLRTEIFKIHPFLLENMWDHFIFIIFCGFFVCI